MKKLLIIWILNVATCAVLHAQLLEDTDKKLKNAKVEKRGFLFFGRDKKVKNSPRIPSSKKEASPRYSKASSPFKFNRGTSPRYSSPREKTKRYTTGVRSSGGVSKFKSVASSPRVSPGNPFRGTSYKPAPRLSSGNPFRGVNYKVTPKYSAGGNPFRGNKYRVAPRYSQGNRFSDMKSKTSPRYSPPNPFRNQEYKVSPRYSVGNPFKGYRFKINPRYTEGMPFRAKHHNVSPRYSTTSSQFKKSRFAYNYSPVRYSEGMPFRGKDYNIKPRYSKGMPFRGKDYKIKPRYSEGMPFRGIDYKISPRYTGTKLDFFRLTGNRELTIKSRHQKISLWEGNAAGEQLPFLLQQWDKFWSRLNGNLPKSGGVKDSGKKAKFDKKERVIWNN